MRGPVLGNLPASMYRRGTGTTRPTKPLSPEGSQRSPKVPSLTGVPDGNESKLQPRVKEGNRASAKQPMLTGVPDGNESKLQPRVAEGAARGKKQPMLKGVGRGGGGATPRVKKTKSGGAKKDGADGMYAAGAPGINRKASKKAGFINDTYRY